jgi:hypothetical protein
MGGTMMGVLAESASFSFSYRFVSLILKCYDISLEGKTPYED